MHVNAPALARLGVHLKPLIPAPAAAVHGPVSVQCTLPVAARSRPLPLQPVAPVRVSVHQTSTVHVVSLLHQHRSPLPPPGVPFLLLPAAFFPRVMYVICDSSVQQAWALVQLQLFIAPAQGVIAEATQSSTSIYGDTALIGAIAKPGAALNAFSAPEGRRCALAWLQGLDPSPPQHTVAAPLQPRARWPL